VGGRRIQLVDMHQQYRTWEPACVCVCVRMCVCAPANLDFDQIVISWVSGNKDLCSADFQSLVWSMQDDLLLLLSSRDMLTSCC